MIFVTGYSFSIFSNLMAEEKLDNLGFKDLKTDAKSDNTS